MLSSTERGATGKSSRLDSPHDPREHAPRDSQKESWLRFCFSVARVLAIQIVLLIALSGAFVAYLNWSSAKSFAEFMSAGAMLAPSNPSLQSIKGVNPCDRGA